MTEFGNFETFKQQHEADMAETLTMPEFLDKLAQEVQDRLELLESKPPGPLDTIEQQHNYTVESALLEGASQIVWRIRQFYNKQDQL